MILNAYIINNLKETLNCHQWFLLEKGVCLEVEVGIRDNVQYYTICLYL